jgi:hypothetical protein
VAPSFGSTFDVTDVTDVTDLDVERASLLVDADRSNTTPRRSLGRPGFLDRR